MINRLIKFLSSMQLMSILILLFAFACGYGTFIETDYGRKSAFALVYNTWWFEGILALLTYSLINNLIKYKLFRLEKIAALTFHLSFILILIGAGITRYVSYSGVMEIREGESKDYFLSDDTFLGIHINDKIDEKPASQLNYDKKLGLSGITRRHDKTPILKYLFSNYFSVKPNFKDHNIKIEYLDFLPNVKESSANEEGIGFMITSKNLELTSEKGTNVSLGDMDSKKILSGENISFKDVEFTLNNPIEGALNFYSQNGGLMCVAPDTASVMSMPPDGKGSRSKMPGEHFEISGMTLITINSLKFVIRDVKIVEGSKSLYSSSNNMRDDYEPRKAGLLDALIVKVTANGKEKRITLKGRNGLEGMPESFSIDDLNFRLSYGSKRHSVPFGLKLRDFQLDRYAGTGGPASYASEVSIVEKETETKYRIFMNNVLNYKGFRFFQSSYRPDEKSTILSVNHDWWGTLITYIGYALMALGMILVFLTKSTRFNSLTQKLKKLTR